jgi:hypothetical protein
LFTIEIVVLILFIFKEEWILVMSYREITRAPSPIMHKLGWRNLLYYNIGDEIVGELLEFL